MTILCHTVTKATLTQAHRQHSTAMPTAIVARPDIAHKYNSFHYGPRYNTRSTAHPRPATPANGTGKASIASATALIENERTPNLTQHPSASLENKTTSHQFLRPPQPASFRVVGKEAKLEEPGTTMPEATTTTTRLAADDPLYSEHFTSSMFN
jgi:hypothetical protein